MEVVVTLGPNETPARDHALSYVSGLLAPARTAPVEGAMALITAVPEGWTEDQVQSALASFKVDQEQVVELLNSAKWDAEVVK